ncbi:MAG TPA: substrate-binding domain-containing protein [Aggregatilineaceae bacterium]|nr:substrate-binding domain-containing protein [Aggregatilineaceae bacterium]
MTRKLLALLLVAVLLIAACGDDKESSSDNKKATSKDSEDTPKSTITISGAFALYPMVQKWADEYKALHPEVEFNISAGGAGKGMSDVLAGAVDVAMVSREIRAEETDQGAVGFAVTKDAVVATVNADNPVLDQLLTVGLTPEKGKAIWIDGEMTTWGEVVGSDNNDPISVYTRADSAGAAEVWALFIGGEAQEDLVAGIGMQGDPGLAEAVRQDPMGIGFNNIGFAYDLTTGQAVEGIRVVPIDLNGDGQINDDENFYADKSSITAAIADGRYPSPPARELYVVTKGEPNAAVTAFIRWILTDGQQYVDAAGYVQLADESLQATLNALPQ